MLSLARPAAAIELALPPRPRSDLTGSAFAHSVERLPLAERERKVAEAILAGNMPRFLRRLSPVHLAHGAHAATAYVTPDYLAVGSDDDHVLFPLSPMTAQTIADALGCALPTPRLVDAIYRGAVLKLEPTPIPPSPAMTTVPVFVRHSLMVRAQRGLAEPGSLVAGHKKDVVLTNRLAAEPGKVAIYGWHRPDGRPIQPLYTGHTASWVDYSHGIRLLDRRLVVDGRATTLDAVLADPDLAPLLSDEGVMIVTRYVHEASLTLHSDEARAPARREVIDWLTIEPGLRIAVNRPALIATEPILLVLYALPNGNTIEQTAGRPLRPGDDWHFDIQHIAAQTRFLRARIPGRALVVAYLENDRKSWPAWRSEHGDGAILAIVRAIGDRFPRETTRLVLGGHSGGGSFVFGYLNSVEAIPDEVERLIFLDSTYAYETDRHADKLRTWLKSSSRHFLCVAAYNDAAGLLDGKPFVTVAGGTWGRSRLMLGDLGRTFHFSRKQVTPVLEVHSALEGRVRFLLRENPERAIFHTIQVERNGFIESLVSGTADEGAGYEYLGARAYSRFIRDDPGR